MNLAEATWTDVADRRPRVLVVPLGSTEQHGPHLPLDTDTRIAVAIAEGACARSDTVALAPALAFGASGEHAGFDGTMSIGTEVLADVIVELVRSTVPPFERVVVVNGHGGNQAALARAQLVCRREHRRLDVWCPTIPGADAHAGRTETALMLAIAPEVVRRHAAVTGATEPLSELLPVLRSAGVAAVSPSGVLGDPAGASATEGYRLLDALVADLGRVIS